MSYVDNGSSSRPGTANSRSGAAPFGLSGTAYATPAQQPGMPSDAHTPDYSSPFEFRPPGSSHGRGNTGEQQAYVGGNAQPSLQQRPLTASNDHSPYAPHGQQQHASASASASTHINNDPWSYSVPSPPPHAAALPTTPAPAGSADIFQFQEQLANGMMAMPQSSTHFYAGHTLYSGFNASNTRPMTAPSTMHPQAYYHSSQYGGMFPASTYSVAGFPQSLAGRNISPGSLASMGSDGMPMGGHTVLHPPATAIGMHRPRPMDATAPGTYQYQPGAPYNMRPPGSSGGLANAPQNARHISSIASHVGHSAPAHTGIFAHQPPPTSAGGYPGFSFGAAPGSIMPVNREPSMPTYPHLSHNPARPRTGTAEHARFATLASATGINAIGGEFGYSTHDHPRLGSSHGLRPGTADTVRPDTARPDTAVSTYSTYSNASTAFAGPSTYHPALYNTVGPHPLAPITPNGSANTRSEAAHPSSDHQPAERADGKFNYIPLPTLTKKRPRRRFEEIERIYDCSYPGCTKAYGTLNHLNAHVSMQKHGPKRLPAEFKEVRKAWRQRKKEHDKQAANRSLEDKDDEDIDEDDDESREPQAEGEATDGADISVKPSQVTPPTSGSILQTPTFSGESIASNGTFGYAPWMQNYGNSPGTYQRPSTAPSHVPNHAFGAMGPNGFIIAAPNPVLVPNNYLGQRKSSLSSVAPPFASIVEEDSTDSNNDSDPSLFSFGTYLQADSVTPEQPPHLSPSHLSALTPSVQVKDASPGSTHPAKQSPLPLHQPYAPPISYATFLDSPNEALVAARPSTAPSPFRFSASTFGSTSGLDSLSSAYDMLDKNTPTSLDDLSKSPGHWSPHWKTVAARVAQYKQEIH